MYNRNVEFVVYVNWLPIGVDIAIKYGAQNELNWFNKPFI